jgi:hypothetical protein
MLCTVVAACTGDRSDIVPESGAESEARTGRGVPAVGGSSVLIVDSVPWSREDTDGVLYQVAVRTAEGTDTLRNVLTEDMPILIGDSLVIGIGFHEDRVDSLFRYSLKSRTLSKTALPADIDSLFSGISLSGDGRRLAYVVQVGEYAFARIVTLPGYNLVGVTDSVAIPPGDFFINATAFPKPDSVVVCIDITQGGMATWFRTRLNLSPWRATKDTVVNGPC